MQVVLATGNQAKVRELRRILDDVGVELVPRDELGLPAPPETGDSFAANALLKARAAAESTGLVALADDSGLEVDALDGAPGVRSARYAGPDADDAANNARLLAELEGVGEDDRTARFVAVAAVVAPDGRSWTRRAATPGRILREPRGQRGFGYDPLFVSAGRQRTNAQLSGPDKDADSHRGKAFRAIRPVLARLAAEAAEA